MLTVSQNPLPQLHLLQPQEMKTFPQHPEHLVLQQIRMTRLMAAFLYEYMMPSLRHPMYRRHPRLQGVPIPHKFIIGGPLPPQNLEIQGAPSQTKTVVESSGPISRSTRFKASPKFLSHFQKGYQEDAFCFYYLRDRRVLERFRQQTSPAVLGSLPFPLHDVFTTYTKEEDAWNTNVPPPRPPPRIKFADVHAELRRSLAVIQWIHHGQDSMWLADNKHQAVTREFLLSNDTVRRRMLLDYETHQDSCRLTKLFIRDLGRDYPMRIDKLLRRLPWLCRQPFLESDKQYFKVRVGLHAYPSKGRLKHLQQNRLETRQTPTTNFSLTREDAKYLMELYQLQFKDPFTKDTRPNWANTESPIIWLEEKEGEEGK